jgi:hypothetical protein
MNPPTPDRVDAVARWLHEHDWEGAYTFESTAFERREQARELLEFLESLDEEVSARIEKVLREWVIPGPAEDEDVDEWFARLVAAIVEATRS